MRAMIDSIFRVLAFSTTTPLGANAVYTSPSIDAINYSRYGGIVTSDQAGSSFLQYSDDGTNWYNGTGTANSLAANAVQQNIAANMIGRYIRIVYTNGTTAQGSFRANLYLIP